MKLKLRPADMARNDLDSSDYEGWRDGTKVGGPPHRRDPPNAERPKSAAEVELPRHI